MKSFVAACQHKAPPWLSGSPHWANKPIIEWVDLLGHPSLSVLQVLKSVTWVPHLRLIVGLQKWLHKPRACPRCQN